jgi:hypothetical protein
LLSSLLIDPDVCKEARFQLIICNNDITNIEQVVGYNRNAEKKDTLTLEAGLGVIPMFGAAVTIEKEPNQQSIDNTSENLPKPLL